ncbi:MAG: hypothetical protein HY774_24745 [Acidobacteria bacterium]|nr:hypothetical protein [Acidobacteriota bacterium]
MGNTGFLKIKLMGVERKPIHDQVGVKFFQPDNRQIGNSHVISFPSAQLFELPAFPQVGNIRLDIAPSRYRDFQTSILMLPGTSPVEKEYRVVRDPETWKAKFVKWMELPPEFDLLKEVLKNSPSVQLVQKGSSSNLGLVTGDTFDGLNDTDARLAKTALLNLYYKMREPIEPTLDQPAWFSFVQQILTLGRERFVAVVRDDMWAEVNRSIKLFGNIYQPADPSLHRKNIPGDLRILEMISLKSFEAHANLQLTLSRVEDHQGGRQTILDADLDENGKALAHFFDLLKHIFNGGTHPYDIHEFLVMTNSGIQLGYKLA